MRKPLAELMAERKLGVVELARRAGVTHAAISQILHGLQVPNLRTARRIASAMGVGVDEIVFPAESGEAKPTRSVRTRPSLPVAERGGEEAAA